MLVVRVITILQYFSAQHATMRDNCTTLYPNDIVGQKVSAYADGHSVALPEPIVKYHEWVLATQERSYFTISLLEARMLVWLARMIDAKRGMPRRFFFLSPGDGWLTRTVLEVGTYVGFSAAAWSHAVGETGSVTTLERSKEYADLARRRLDQLGMKNVQVVEGDALET